MHSLGKYTCSFRQIYLHVIKSVVFGRADWLRDCIGSGKGSIQIIQTIPPDYPK